MTEEQPNPGSGLAIENGCTCPVLDNAHGKGWKGGARCRETGETLFMMNLSCPLHGRTIEEMCDG